MADDSRGARVIRELGLGRTPPDFGWDVLYPVAATVPLCLLGIHLMRRRLVK